MSRLEEVNKKIEYMLDAPSHQIEECFEESIALARTLAAEVDELRAELARVKAESLRVVPFDIDDLPGWEHIINDLYTHDGRNYINIDDEQCQKVLLVPWEGE